jgi:tRNA(His) 5'-end guanylyltransferase
MKRYEESTNRFSLDPTKPYIVRLDGHHFSRFLSAFNKPNDSRIHRAMVKTTQELVFHFKPTTGFTCSDEITLVFPVDPNNLIAPPFSGRIVKLCTLLSGMASTAFYKNLITELVESENLLRHVQKTLPHFDARVFNVPENYELVNNILWRHAFDYRRNSIAGLAQRNFSYKVLHGLHSDQLLAKLLEKGIDWHNCDPWYKWGAFVKLEKYQVLVWIGKKQGIEVPVQKEVTKIRSVVIIRELQKKYNKEDEHFILTSYIESTNPPLSLPAEEEINEEEETKEETKEEK